jgi:uncharacterized protein (DUF1778 family)
MELRKPLVRMEPKEERLTVRVTRTARALYEAAAHAEGEELSRYLRSCIAMGHSMKEAQRLVKAAGA